MKRYHVVSINSRTRRKVYCTNVPLSHGAAYAKLNTFSAHPERKMMLESVR